MIRIVLAYLLITSFSCKLQQNPEDMAGNGTSLFSIDGSGLKKITGVTSTKSAGQYAVENNFVPTASAVKGFGLASGGSVAEINQRCGLKVGMTVVMALSYLDGQTTGQLGGKAVACKSMRGDVYQSIEWKEGEICFSPQNLTTTQLVRAPGHTDGSSSLMSLTEYCENYTDFFLAMQKPSGLGLTTGPLVDIPDADTLYVGGLNAAQGSVDISLAGSKLNFAGKNSFVLTHEEGGSKTNGFSLQGESYSQGAKVRAYHEGSVGFRGFTFSEKGKGQMMAGEAYQPGEIPSEGSVNSFENLSNPGFGGSDPTAFALQGAPGYQGGQSFFGPPSSATPGQGYAPTGQDLGLEPQTSGSFSGDRDLPGGEFQIFWQ
jgi:hypothetical protein